MGDDSRRALPSLTVTGIDNCAQRGQPTVVVVVVVVVHGKTCLGNYDELYYRRYHRAIVYGDFSPQL